MTDSLELAFASAIPAPPETEPPPLTFEFLLDAARFAFAHDIPLCAIKRSSFREWRLTPPRPLIPSFEADFSTWLKEHHA